MSASVIRVGFLYPHWTLGGVGRTVLTLLSNPREEIRISGMAVQSWQLFDVAAQRRSPMTIWGRGPAPEHIRDLPGVQVVPDFRSACQAVIDASDVLFLWGFTTPEPALDQVDWRGRKVIVTAHGSCAFTRRVLGVLEPYATHYCAVSHIAAAQWGPTRRSQVRVLYNGVDRKRLVPSRSRQELRQAWGIAEHDRVLAYIGRLVPGKNPLAIAQAVRELGSPWRALFVGSGYAGNEVQRDAQQLLGSRAIFTGPIEPIGDAFAMLDCFLLASPSEGHCQALNEAWAAGVPVVSTRVGAVPELEAEYGRLVVPVPVSPTPQELARAVQEAIAPANRQVIRRAQEMMFSRFTESHMLAERCRYLREVMAEDVPWSIVPRPSPPPIRDVTHSPAAVTRNGASEFTLVSPAAPPLRPPGAEHLKTLHVIYDVEGWAYWHLARGLASSPLLAAGGWQVTIGREVAENPVDVVLLLNYSRIAEIAQRLRSQFPISRLVVSFNSGGGRNRPLLEQCLQSADRVIVINRETFDSCREAAHVVYIPYPYQDAVFHTRQPDSPRPPRILWSASRSYAEHKGHSLMRSLQPRLEQQGYEVDLRVVDSYGNKVFTPQEMADWYRTGRVYVVASLNEGTPVGGLEAAACGNAIVSTRVGVMPEWIRDGVNGLLVERTEESLLAGILKAARIADRLTQHSLHDIRIYSATRLISCYVELLERLVGEPTL